MQEVKEFLGNRLYPVDDTFASKIILPGFIDQHLHPLLGALTLSVEVTATEDWVVPGKTWKKASNRHQYVSRPHQPRPMAEGEFVTAR